MCTRSLIIISRSTIHIWSWERSDVPLPSLENHILEPMEGVWLKTEGTARPVDTKKTEWRLPSQTNKFCPLLFRRTIKIRLHSEDTHGILYSMKTFAATTNDLPLRLSNYETESFSKVMMDITDQPEQPKYPRISDNCHRHSHPKFRQASRFPEMFSYNST